MQNFIEDYCLWLRYSQGRSERTIEKYRYHLKRFFRESACDPLQATNEHVEDLKRKLLEAKKDKLWINYLLITIRGFYLWLRDEKEVEIRVRPEKIHLYGRGLGMRDRKIDYFTREEFEEIVKLINPDNLDGVRLRALCELLYGTGMRISEALSLNRNSIKGNKVRIMGKGERERTVYVAESALRWIGDYLVKRKDYHEALFVSYTKGDIRRWGYDSVSKCMQHLRRKWNNDKRLRCHAFRHSIATDLYYKTQDILFVKDILGHQDINTTIRYYRGVDEEKILKRFLENTK